MEAIPQRIQGDFSLANRTRIRRSVYSVEAAQRIGELFLAALNKASTEGRLIEQIDYRKYPDNGYDAIDELLQRHGFAPMVLPTHTRRSQSDFNHPTVFDSVKAANPDLRVFWRDEATRVI